MDAPVDGIVSFYTLFNYEFAVREWREGIYLLIPLKKLFYGII